MFWTIRINQVLGDSLKAWGLLVGGVAAILGIDFASRFKDGDNATGGLSGEFAFLLIALIALPALFYLCRAVAGAPVIIRIALVLCQCIIIVILLSVISLTYRCNMGIICP